MGLELASCLDTSKLWWPLCVFAELGLACLQGS